MDTEASKMNNNVDLFSIRDMCRANFNPYLSRVFSRIPDMDDGYMLDIGCGTGVSSCEIARERNLNILAMDIDEASLKALRRKVAQKGYERRIKVQFGTFETAIETGHKFDIVLAEGLFNIIGFEKGLRLTSSVLKDNGYLVLHDGVTNSGSKKKAIKSYGFSIEYKLELDENFWGEKYCKCLEKKLRSMDGSKKLSEDEEGLLKQIRSDLELYRSSPESFKSVYYILHRNGK